MGVGCGAPFCISALYCAINRYSLREGGFNEVADCAADPPLNVIHIISTLTIHGGEYRSPIRATIRFCFIIFISF